MSAARFFAPAYCGAVLRPGVLLQRPAERQVLHPSARAESGGVRGHERERPLLVVPVLGQVEADSPHLMPARGPRAQKRRQAAGRGPDGFAHPRVQVAPDPLQAVLGEILAPVHRGGGQNPGRAVGRRRGLDLNTRLVLRQMAQRGQVAFGDLLPEAQGGRFMGVDTVRRQREERGAPVGVEGGLQGREGGRDGVAGARRPAQLPGRRQSETHVDGWRP